MSKKPDPQFSRHRTIDEVIVRAKETGVRVDTARWRLGSDFVTVELPGPQGVLVPVLYNTFNGRFFYQPPVGAGFSSTDTQYDGEPWFDAMLAFFYVPKEGEQ
jgi:hypothetical protein